MEVRHAGDICFRLALQELHLASTTGKGSMEATGAPRTPSHPTTATLFNILEDRKNEHLEPVYHTEVFVPLNLRLLHRIVAEEVDDLQRP